MPVATVDDVDLHYLDDGDGDREVVLLVPGLGATTTSFGGIVPLLVPDYRTVAVDLRGVGRSSRRRQEYTMELWASDLVALLDRLDIDRCHVVGSSLGGCVAQVLAATFPERVASLVLAASFAEVDRALELNYRVRIGLIDAVGMDSTLFGDCVRAALFGRSFLDTELGELVSAGAVAMLRDNPPEIYTAHLRALLRFGECDLPPAERSAWRERLARIRCPALVLCGDEDVLTVPALSARMARHLADATFVVQPGSGHANLVEQPEVAADHTLRFLGKVRSGAPLG